MFTKQLTDLINSLSKSEKRYFKVNAQVVKTNKNLIQLFEIIEGDKYTTIEDVYTALETNGKKLPVLETRLQTLVLRHLRSYYSTSSYEIELHNLLIEIEILYNKRLFKNCAKIILKAKKLAITHESHLTLLNLLKWESYIEKESGKYLKKSQVNMVEILNKELKILSDYTRLVKYKQQTFNFLLLSKNRMLASLNKEIKTYDKLINESYFDVQDYHSFEEKLFLLNFKGMYFLSKSRLKECLIEYENLVELIENSNRKNILKSQEYFFGMNNLLLLQVLNKDYENYNTTLNKIYHQFKGFIEYKPLLFSVTKCYELGIYCEIGNVQKGLQLIPEIDNGLKTYKLVINEVNKLLFYLNIAIIYYFDKNYSKAIYWLNKFLNDYSINKKSVSSNIFYYGNIINIIIHYDAANYDTIDYMYNQCQTNLKKIRKISQFDNLILKFIKKASKKASKKVYTRNIEKKEDFKILKNQLKLLVNNPLEAISLEFFDFFAWIDSHIENKNISEIIQEKKLS